MQLVKHKIAEFRQCLIGNEQVHANKENDVEYNNQQYPNHAPINHSEHWFNKSPQQVLHVEQMVNDPVRYDFHDIDLMAGIDELVKMVTGSLQASIKQVCLGIAVVDVLAYLLKLLWRTV